MIELIKSLNVYNVFSPKVRVGTNADGGYVVNELLTSFTQRLISIGMGLEDTFEVEWFGKYNTFLEAYDGTYVCQTLCPKYSEFVNEKIFYINHNVGYGQKDIPLDVILSGKQDVLLKMDTEGAEYKLLSKPLPSNVVGVLLEVHDLQVKENQQKLVDILQNSLKDYFIFHIHGNSWAHTFDLDVSKLQNNAVVVKDFPTVLELSFIHKRLLSNWELDSEQYPIAGLDYSNKPDASDIPLKWINSF
jgi:hypothetical protein